MKTTTTRKHALTAIALAGLVSLGGASPTVATVSDTQTNVTSVGQASPLAATGTGAGSCSAQGASFSDASQNSSTDTQMTLVDGEEARSMKEATLAALTEGDVSTHSAHDAHAVEDAKVYTVASNGVEVTSVTIPVGGEFSTLSNVTVVLDQDGKVTQYSETLFGENDEGNFNVTTYVDGEFANSNDTDLPYMTDEDLAVAGHELVGTSKATTMGAGSTAACVATVLGVSGATAYLIVGACAGACTIPIAGTAICVACIGAYAAVGGASITAVASCF